ncbi:MAG: AMP-binding protein [Bacteroidales bacterium]|jgi:acyl-CoA synthetase (AMP-forming)/AMP-acid ligase II/acyl carrier protein|nr:AMP-binding protein [Bacteroidales bacterium]
MNKSYPQHLVSISEGTIFPAETMVELLLKHAENIPEKVVYTLLEDGINEKASITYAEMVRKAKAIAASLLKGGKKGDRVLLLFPTGINFITAFYGCFFAGMIAVPTYPPKRNKANERFRSIVSDSKPTFIITTDDIRSDLEKYNMLDGLHPIDEILIYDEIAPEIATEWKDPGIKADDLALLQYTSGSTGTPNGVMVDHANIIHNSEFIKQSFGFDDQSVGVNWLPNFHDMGLIGCLIQAAYLGGSNVIIPPLAFMKSPANWFRAITKYRATTGGGPNFAYDYCLEKTTDEELSEFDLGSLRTMYCGAEPIRQTTLAAFTDRFRKANFKASQFFPVYGMAESVLIVTGGDYKADPVYFTIDAKASEERQVKPATAGRESRVLTACGYPWLGMEVVIIDPETKKPAPQGFIGEVWARGPSVARGYWNDKERTNYTFRAYIEGTGDGPWLRTGDLGFIHEGQLYISGRIKDLIIIRGSNFFPNDIEHSIEQCHAALRQNASVAFSADINGQERLVVLAEVERTHIRDLDEDGVFEAIRQSIMEEHAIQPYAICLLRTGSAEKTSSGKIRRFAMKQAWQKEELTLVASWEMKPDKAVAGPGVGYRPEFLREWMINWMARKLEIDPDSIDPGKQVSAYGLDSMVAVELERDVKNEFGIDWPLESFLKENTINDLVEEGMDLLRRKS